MPSLAKDESILSLGLAITDYLSRDKDEEKTRDHPGEEKKRDHRDVEKKRDHHDRSHSATRRSSRSSRRSRRHRDHDRETETETEPETETGYDGASVESTRGSDIQQSTSETASTRRRPAGYPSRAISEGMPPYADTDGPGRPRPRGIPPLEQGTTEWVPPLIPPPVPAHEYEQSEPYRGADECFMGEAEYAAYAEFRRRE
ncbi:hypothetical protein LTR08_000250 [Meristemomyces frigidus]|nr:hypothetical protein LTR08_000250 [Meristemomyces frigidus]